MEQWRETEFEADRKYQLGDLGFKTSDLLANAQVLLLSFLIPFVKAVHLRGNFVKTFTHLISKRADLSLQFLPKKQT